MGLWKLLMTVRLDMEDPNWRSESQLADMRAFKAAALDMQSREDRFVSLPQQHEKQSSSSLLLPILPFLVIFLKRGA